MMDKPIAEAIKPFAIFREALSRWAYNYIPVVAIYGINIFFARIFDLTNKKISGLPLDRSTADLYLVLFLVFAAFVIVNAFVSLLIMTFFTADKKRPKFAAAFEETRHRVAGYLKALFLLILFGFVVGGFGSFVMAFGHAYYMSVPLSPSHIPVLIAAGTVFVTCVIIVVWYGFFFSLGPLIGAFEKKSALTALRESRARIRGNALRYCFVFLLFGFCYLLLGLCAYGVAKSFSMPKFIFRLIDPAMSAMFGHLWLALWFVTYQKLTEIRIARR